MHERILTAGHSIRYSVICDVIQKRLCARQEAFIRQEYAAGRVCAFDWGAVKLEIDGTCRRYQLAVFTSAYSHYRFAMWYIR